MPTPTRSHQGEQQGILGKGKQEQHACPRVLFLPVPNRRRRRRRRTTNGSDGSRGGEESNPWVHEHNFIWLSYSWRKLEIRVRFWRISVGNIHITVARKLIRIHLSVSFDVWQIALVFFYIYHKCEIKSLQAPTTCREKTLQTWPGALPACENKTVCRSQMETMNVGTFPYSLSNMLNHSSTFVSMLNLHMIRSGLQSWRYLPPSSYKYSKQYLW